MALALAAISKPRASASVSIYSRMFVTLPFRTVKAKTQWSSNALFVADSPATEADDQNPVSLRYEFAGL